MAHTTTTENRPLGTIPPPEPNLTADEVLRRAEAMRPLLRERQAACEANGQVSEDTNTRFIEAGFYRILQPRCFGGYEFDLPTFLKVMIAISRGCSDSGWVLALTAGHAFLIASYPEAGQREAFARVNRALLESARRSRHVYLLDYDSIVARYGDEAWHDERLWASARLPIGPAQLTRIARIMDRVTVVRSVHHPYPVHGVAYAVTGMPTYSPSLENKPRDPQHWPFIGSVVDFLDEQRGFGRGAASPPTSCFR